MSATIYARENFSNHLWLMAPTNNSSESLHENARYEYRVWGKHRKARKKLAGMATARVDEEIEDCYLLVDDEEWNAKVRNSKLKIKQLISHKRGFERWESNWHTTAEDAPAPFDDVFETLRLDRPQRGKRYDLSEAVTNLELTDDARAVFVTKHRRRYRVGALRAEVTRIEVHEHRTTLHSMAVQGDSIKELKALLRALGLDGLPNIPMHAAIASSTSES